MKDHLMQSPAMQYHQPSTQSQDNLPTMTNDPLMFLAKLQIGAPLQMAPSTATIPSKEKYLAVVN